MILPELAKSSRNRFENHKRDIIVQGMHGMHCCRIFGQSQKIQVGVRNNSEILDAYYA